MKLKSFVPFGNLSTTLPVDVKARLLQTADEDMRTPSSMLAYLLASAIPEWWRARGKQEPEIKDPIAWLRARIENRKTEE